MELTVGHLFALVVGVILGVLAAWRVFGSRTGVSRDAAFRESEIERTALSTQLTALQQNLADTHSRFVNLEDQHQSLRCELEKASAERAQWAERASRVPHLEEELTVRLAESTTLKASLAEVTAKLEAQTKHAQADREEMLHQFKALAGEILEDKSRKFTDQNKSNLEQLLGPLREQLTNFKAKVEEVYVAEGKDRSALAEQVRQLMQLNQTLSQDAQNLTLALRGDRKLQGNWGEIILEDILEKAGLLRGQHYEAQASMDNEAGERQVPDIVVRLPGDRCIVIDSKVTLLDYRALANADQEQERDGALSRHLACIRKHIKGLSEKNYQNLYQLNSLDFVIMFVPLEPAFMVAVTHDRELFQQAWEKNVLLVSPSTLLFVIRTVSNLWRQEAITRNAREVSRRGAELYDKLVGFVEDLKDVGRRIGQAQKSFDDARKKLCDGRGNVLRQAEMLKAMGVNPSKSLPADWVDEPVDDESTQPQLPAAGSDL